MHLGQAMQIRHILRLVLFICGLINGRLMPDLSGHGFVVGWSMCVYYMIEDAQEYAFSAMMLGKLYHDMHLYLY